jgi:hypothetical protein
VPLKIDGKGEVRIGGPPGPGSTVFPSSLNGRDFLQYPGRPAIRRQSDVAA